MATSPLPSRGLTRGQNCYVNLAFAEIPNAKRGDEIRSGYVIVAFSGATRGWNCYVTPAFSGAPNAKPRDKIRSGYLTRAFMEAQKRAELLRNPCILRDPQQGKKN